MNWLDRFVIAPVAPGWALRRARARAGLNAFYEMAEPGRTRKKRTDKRSANALNQRSIESLRSQARHLEENLDIAKGALDVMECNVVGTGIQPEPQVELIGEEGEPAVDVNRKLLAVYDDWIHSPEVTRQFDYYSLQRITARSWFRDGEVFGQRIIGNVPKLDHNTVVPYSLEMVEADFVPVDYNDQSKGIVQGVELNGWGQPRAYHLFRTHPGDLMIFGNPSESKRVTADRMLHLKLARRLHQVRGMTVFAPVLSRLDDLKEIDESERVAARVAAAMAGYIKKGGPELFVPPKVGIDGKPELRTMEFVPGMIFDDLKPGEEIGTINSNRPNSALIEFRAEQLRSAASGFGTSFSSLAKNYDGTYSAQRQELVEQYVNYRTMSGLFVFRFCQPIWDGFIDAVLMSGAVEIPSNVNRDTIYNCSHTVPQMPWIDPVKELQAKQIAETQGYTSRSRIIRESGSNPDQVARERLRDKQEDERLGLASGEPSGQEPAEDPDEDRRNKPADQARERARPSRKRK